jgi:hypothetical protein
LEGAGGGEKRRWRDGSVFILGKNGYLGLTHCTPLPIPLPQCTALYGPTLPTLYFTAPECTA